jgi:hypothetical protein
MFQQFYLVMNCNIKESHWGRRFPAGIGLGNLWDNVNVKRDTFSTTSETHEPGGIVFVQLYTYSDQLMADT